MAAKNNMNLKLILTLSALLLVLAGNVSALGETIFLDKYQVSYDYIGADEGSRFTLTASVTNTGASIKENVKLKIDDRSPFSLDNDEWDIGTINPQETKTKSFRVDVNDGAAQGKYRLDFSLEDKNEDFDDNFEIEVSSDKADLIIGSLNSLPSTLSPDTKDVKLEVDLQNLGGGDANFVRARLILPEGFSSASSFSDSADIGIIAAKSSKTVTFYIDISKNVSSGAHDAKIELEYSSENEEKIASLAFKIPVKGKPQYEIVSSKTSPGKVETGSTGTLSITLKNIGEEKGEETSVRVFENSDFPITFDEKTNFVGTIQKGEHGTATFKFDTDLAGNPNKYLIRVQIRTLQKGNVLVEEYTVPIEVIKAESFSAAGYLVLGLTLLLAIVFISLVYKVSRRKKEQD